MGPIAQGSGVHKLVHQHVPLFLDSRYANESTSLMNFACLCHMHVRSGSEVEESLYNAAAALVRLILTFCPLLYEAMRVVQLLGYLHAVPEDLKRFQRSLRPGQLNLFMLFFGSNADSACSFAELANA